MNCLSVSDHFVGLALKRLILETKLSDDPEISMFSAFNVFQDLPSVTDSVTKFSKFQVF